MKDKIITIAKANGADLVGFAPAERFAADDPIFQILPETIGVSQRGGNGGFAVIGTVQTHGQHITLNGETFYLLLLEQGNHLRIGDGIAGLTENTGDPGKGHGQYNQVNNQ